MRVVDQPHIIGKLNNDMYKKEDRVSFSFLFGIRNSLESEDGFVILWFS